MFEHTPAEARDKGVDGEFTPLPLARGDLYISGTSHNMGARAYVVTDRVGWTTVALISGWHDPVRVAHLLARSEDPQASPVAVAASLKRHIAGPLGVGVLRLGPEGRLVEVLNASLATVLQWDPVEGLYPCEPLADSHAQLPGTARAELIALPPGGAVVMATEGLLNRSADFRDLRSFSRAIGLDPIGGELANVSPEELTRLVDCYWPAQEGPVGMVIVGNAERRSMVA